MIRFLDIVLSSIALILLLPVLLLVAVILALTGERQVFYKQSRIGLQGAEFSLLKFATMKKDSVSIGGPLTKRDDPRVLPFGRILRATKINELPQLINVLCGDMSIIGPRPQIHAHFLLYDESVRSELIKIKPGLSGTGSIIFRDEERLFELIDGERDDIYASHIAPYKGLVEAWYVDNYSVFTYFLLIFLTIEVVVRPESKLYQKLLPTLPVPRGELARHFNN